MRAETKGLIFFALGVIVLISTLIQTIKDAENSAGAAKLKAQQDAEDLINRTEDIIIRLESDAKADSEIARKEKLEEAAKSTRDAGKNERDNAENEARALSEAAKSRMDALADEIIEKVL